jgi:hypothetical protein
MKTTALSAMFAVIVVIIFAGTALACDVSTSMPAAPGSGPQPVITVEPAPVTETEPVPTEVSPPMISGAGPAVVAPTFENSQLVTLTVAEAWDLSGHDYNVFNSMVGQLANLSAQKRGIYIPNTDGAGQELGKMIRSRAEADRNQLLYVVVDSSVKDYAVRHPQGK